MNKPHSITLFYSHSYSQKIIVLWNPGRVWLRCIVILSSYELTWKLIHNSSRLNSNLNKHFNNPSHFGDILNFWYFELFQKIVHTTSTSCIIPLYSTNILVCHFFFWWFTRHRKRPIHGLGTSWIIGDSMRRTSCWATLPYARHF